MWFLRNPLVKKHFIIGYFGHLQVKKRKKGLPIIFYYPNI